MYTLTCDKCKTASVTMRNGLTNCPTDWLNLKVSTYIQQGGTIHATILLCPDCAEGVINKLRLAEGFTKRSATLEDLFFDMVSEIVDDRLSGP